MYSVIVTVYFVTFSECLLLQNMAENKQANEANIYIYINFEKHVCGKELENILHEFTDSRWQMDMKDNQPQLLHDRQYQSKYQETQQ